MAPVDHGGGVDHHVHALAGLADGVGVAHVAHPRDDAGQALRVGRLQVEDPQLGQGRAGQLSQDRGAQEAASSSGSGRFSGRSRRLRERQ